MDHRQCLLDSYNVTECPHCKNDLTSPSPSGEQQILCTLKNEGGLQQNLDILPILTEEMYLKAYPEERKCQAFLEFCGEGDIEAIVDMLKEENEDGDEEDEEDEEEEEGLGIDYSLLRYQDQIHTMNSGLHIAIQNQRTEVAWLLLLLASALELSAFPTEVIDAAKRLEVQRENDEIEPDIRDLRDNEGKTAEERAMEIGGVWLEWVNAGRLKSNH